MGRKVAIFDNEDVKQFLRVARTIDDEVRTFMMTAFGMHPENLRRLKVGKKGDRITEEGVLEFKRAKNAKPRRELLESGVSDVIRRVIMKGRRGLKVSNTYYEQICESQGNIIKEYSTPPVSPMTLRHTYALNELRRHDFDYFLVAEKMGCGVSILRQNYLDLEQWERIHKKELREPLDLTHWKFREES